MIEHIREWNLTEFNVIPRPDFKKTAIELGSGNGQFIVEMALKNPDTYFFAVERLALYVNKTRKKGDRLQLSNLYLINGDIFTCLTRFFEPGYFDDIYINFPDPWVKKSHLKKRVVQDRLVKIYSDLLKENGRLFFVTDNPPYRDFGIAEIMYSGLFEPLFTSPYYTENYPDYPVTLYEDKWRREGRGIFYCLFRKK